MTISVVFDPPLPSDSPAVFNSKAFTLVGDLNTFSTEANATAAAVNSDVTDPGVVAIGADLIGANTIGDVSAIALDVVAVAAIDADVSTVAAIAPDVVAVAANAANINAAVADLPSLAAKVSKTGDTMSGPLVVPAGASGTQVPQAQEVALLATTQIGGHRNMLINGDFSQNVRGLTSVADDTYFLDRWYVLTESGSVTVAQLTDAESGAPFGVRLTQPDASPKRMGFAQIIESKNIRQYASRAMHLAARLRLSTGANIRYAVIEHTGTADVVTSDVVSNWASATFTPSNFFIGGINIISTGTITPGASTWGEVSDWDALGATVKNVVVFVWTESQVAQNVTLDCSRIQYEPGVVATPHEWRMNERALARPYARPCPASSGWSITAADAQVVVPLDEPMRATPAVAVITGASALVEPGVAFRTISAASWNGSASGGYIAITSASMNIAKPHFLLADKLLLTAEL
jgi:hypothetical protein